MVDVVMVFKIPVRRRFGADSGLVSAIGERSQGVRSKCQSKLAEIQVISQGVRL